MLLAVDGKDGVVQLVPLAHVHRRLLRRGVQPARAHGDAYVSAGDGARTSRTRLRTPTFLYGAILKRRALDADDAGGADGDGRAAIVVR